MIALGREPSVFIKFQALAPSRGDLSRAIAVVALAHLGLLLVFHYGLPSFTFKKPPDLSIAFYAPPPVPAQAVAPQAVPPPPQPAPKPPPPKPVQKATPKVEPKPEPPKVQPKDTFVMPAPPQETTMAVESPPPAPARAAPAPAQTQAAPAIAATADADYKAAYLKNPKPPYPALAVRMQAEGRVILIAEVLPDGRAGKVQVERSSGFALLDKSALETVKTWRFTPARKDGVIITQAVRIPIDFDLRKKP